MSALDRLRLVRLGCAAGILAAALTLLPGGARIVHAQAGPSDEAASGMSEEELRLRIELLQRSLGFGGIFGPALQDWLNSPSAPPAQGDPCGHYADYAARQACGAGDLWAADRIQEDRASPEERDWYNR
jgi:hypothetical protein